MEEAFQASQSESTRKDVKHHEHLRHLAQHSVDPETILPRHNASTAKVSLEHERSNLLHCALRMRCWGRDATNCSTVRCECVPDRQKEHENTRAQLLTSTVVSLSPRCDIAWCKELHREFTFTEEM